MHFTSFFAATAGIITTYKKSKENLVLLDLHPLYYIYTDIDILNSILLYPLRYLAQLPLL